MIDKNRLHKTSRLRKDFPFYKEIMRRHKEAIGKSEDTYIDPKTGFTVFTAEYLLRKGFCCGSGCRHCPY